MPLIRPEECRTLRTIQAHPTASAIRSSRENSGLKFLQAPKLSVNLKRVPDLAAAVANMAHTRKFRNPAEYSPPVRDVFLYRPALNGMNWNQVAKARFRRFASR
jgi:hypothetical protein